MYGAQGFAGRGGAAAPAGGRPAAGANFSQVGAGSPSGGAKKMVQPIRPVTIKQLLTAERVGDGALFIDSREATQITVCGRVVDYESSAAGAMTAKYQGYKISDGTGLIVVRQWVDGETAQPLHPINSFVRAAGPVKIWQDRLVVTGTVRLIADNNEITYHLLDAALTHLRITRGPVPLKAAAAAGAPSTAPAGAHQNTVGAAPGEKFFPGDVVVSILKNHQKSDPLGGLSIEDVAQQAQKYNFTIQEVRSAMKSLVSEGKIFNVDSFRYAA